MSDLWREDPEAFIILRLQESSDPDSAHRAFQSVLAELARLREENVRLAHGWATQGREVERLREALGRIEVALRKNTPGAGAHEAWTIARNALKETK